MDYEKKYKEALERMKSWANGEHPECFSEAQKTAEFIFPELKESEDKDEMIRQCLIEHIKCNKDLNWSLFQWFKPDTIIAWLEKQGELKECDEEWEVTTGIYKCTKRMFDGTPENRLWFEVGNLYKCISKNDVAEFESSYGHTVFLPDPVVRKHFIKVKD